MIFLIYIRFLFLERKIRGIRTPSYIDDLGLFTCSKSIRKNCRDLKAVIEEILSFQESHLIQFDMKKTELIHFFPSSAEKDENIELNDGTIIKPKTCVRWLGIWLDSKLKFKTHIEKKLSQAEAVLNNIIRLSNTERGLSFQAMRQLYMACITSIADFGIQCWWNNQRNYLEKYQSLQNKALRKILNAFKTSKIISMELEAALPPSEVRFEKAC